MGTGPTKLKVDREEPPACRLCGSAQVECLGRIPDGDYFAGRVLHTPIVGGYLWGCGSCRSFFRHPILPFSAYLDLYNGGAAQQWEADVHRVDLATVRELIVKRRHTDDVLDVGCGTGEFLLTLPAGIRKHGLEPSEAAALVAAREGISVLGRTLRDLPARSRFDVITLIDVIEHIADPLTELDEAADHLSPGGLLIISTGDPSNALWRGVFRSRFWYCSFPEHISFPSLQLLETWRSRHDMQSPQVISIRYRNLKPWRAWVNATGQALYYVNPSIINGIGRCLGLIQRAHEPRRRYFPPSEAGVFRDHQVVAISRWA